MDSRAYEMMAASEDRHWWWEGRRAILRDLLRTMQSRGTLAQGKLYDLGCGVGSNLAVLGEFGDAVGFDSSDQAIAYAHAHGRTNVMHADFSVGAHALDHIPAKSASVVLLADVIEHLDDESPALQLAKRLLREDGVLIVTVPALPILWSASDEFNHHRRRYTHNSLRRALETEFAIDRLTYFNSLLFPLIFSARMVSNLLKRPGEEEIALPSPWINKTLRAIFSSEAQWLRHSRFPVGVSLLCVARPVTNG